MAIYQRIKILEGWKNLSAKEIASDPEFEIAERTATNWLNGTTKNIPHVFFQWIAKHHNDVNLVWLFIGVGSMELKPDEQMSLNEPNAEYQTTLLKKLEETLKKLETLTPQLEKSSENEKRISELEEKMKEILKILNNQ